jgi:3-oxoacyl-[acyl-carrier protein] reductase
MENNFLNGKVVWITGATKGIGKEIAKKLIGSGAKLVLSGSSPQSIKKILDEYNEYSNIFFMPFDLKNSNQIEIVAKKVQAAFGSIDILINNAGIGKFAPFTQLNEEDFDNTMSINLKAPFLLMKQVLPDMLEKKNGTIINILSVVANKPFKNSSIYAASKAALLAMDRSLREEVRSEGIKIIDVLPGATATDIWLPEQLEKYSNRMMKPEDVAEAVVKIIELAMNKRSMVEEISLRPQWGDL